MDGALRLRVGPFQALAFQAQGGGAKVLPACEPVFPGEHKLGVSQRQRKSRNWKLGVDTGQSIGSAGADLTHQFLCLLPDGFKGRVRG